MTEDLASKWGNYYSQLLQFSLQMKKEMEGLQCEEGIEISKDILEIAHNIGKMNDLKIRQILAGE